MNDREMEREGASENEREWEKRVKGREVVRVRGKKRERKGMTSEELIKNGVRETNFYY